MFDFKNYVMKIISKSPARHQVRLQGKLKLTGKNIYILLSFYYMFQYNNVLAISRFQWLIWAEG
jgi:hypothetical protein